jgi:protein PhnA
MQVDNVWSPEMPGFEHLGISPRAPASRAILAEGDVLDVLIQTQRNKASARPDEPPGLMADWPLNERIEAWGYANGLLGEYNDAHNQLWKCSECLMTVVVKDSNGAELKDGDSVTLIKDLKVKGSSVVLKRGALIKNIRLTDDPNEIDCRAEKVKGLVLRTEFVKKA